jgi:hypothetical protein
MSGQRFLDRRRAEQDSDELPVALGLFVPVVGVPVEPVLGRGVAGPVGLRATDRRSVERGVAPVAGGEAA